MDFVYTVDPADFGFGWEVWCRTRYRGFLLARFWFRRNARQLRERLERIERQRAEILQDQAAYDESVAKMTERMMRGEIGIIPVLSERNQNAPQQTAQGQTERPEEAAYDESVAQMTGRIMRGEMGSVTVTQPPHKGVE